MRIINNEFNERNQSNTNGVRTVNNRLDKINQSNTNGVRTVNNRLDKINCNIANENLTKYPTVHITPVSVNLNNMIQKVDYIYLVQFKNKLFKLTDKNTNSKTKLVVYDKVLTFGKEYLLTILNKLDIISLKILLKNRGIEIKDVFNDKEVVEAIYKAVEESEITLYDLYDYSDFKYKALNIAD